MTIPTSNLDRTRTAASANPTPPTNVPVNYQGTPPTPAGLVAAQAPDPDMTDPWLLADPLNGAVATQWTGTDARPVRVELAGKAEADGTEVATDVGSTTGHSVFGDFSETPNTTHPSGSGVRQPLNLTIPTITGTATVGQVLTAVAGTWDGTATITLVESWYDHLGTLLGTGPTYTIVAGNIGKKIQVVESATNAAGTVTATSALTATIT